jgi:hypothetical protein
MTIQELEFPIIEVDPNPSIEEQETIHLARQVMSLGKVAVVESADTARIALGLDADWLGPNNTDYALDLLREREELITDRERIVPRRTLQGDRLEHFSQGVATLQPPQFLLDIHGAQNALELTHSAVHGKDNQPAALNFLQWYHQANAKIEQQFVDKELPGMLMAFESRLAKAVAIGNAPQ